MIYKKFIKILKHSVFVISFSLVITSAHAYTPKIASKNIRIPKASHPTRVLVDRIVARVNGSLVLYSDLIQPKIDRDGQPFVGEDVIAQKSHELYKQGLEQAIDEQLLFIKAAERKMLPTDLEIEKQIVAFKSMHNLNNVSEQELDAHLRSVGLSSRLYRVQLQRILAIHNIRGAELNERVVVSYQDAEDYYKLHKEYQEERYFLKVAHFHTTQFPVVPTKRQLLERKDIKWEEYEPIARSKMASHLSMVFTMKEGEITNPLKTDDGFQLIMLAKREEGRFKSLQEQYGAIEKILQERKREHFEKEFLADLRNQAIISYF